MKKKLLSMGDRLMIQSNRYQNRLNRKKMKELKMSMMLGWFWIFVGFV